MNLWLPSLGLSTLSVVLSDFSSDFSSVSDSESDSSEFPLIPSIRARGSRRMGPLAPPLIRLLPFSLDSSSSLKLLMLRA